MIEINYLGVPSVLMKNQRCRRAIHFNLLLHCISQKDFPLLSLTRDFQECSSYIFQNPSDCKYTNRSSPIPDRTENPPEVIARQEAITSGDLGWWREHGLLKKRERFDPCESCRLYVVSCIDPEIEIEIAIEFAIEIAFDIPIEIAIEIAIVKFCRKPYLCTLKI